MKLVEQNLPSAPDVNDERPAAQSGARRERVSRTLFLAAAGLIGIVLARDILSETPDITGKAAPSLRATQTDGQPISLADFAGKVVLIDFWSRSCGPCVAQIPTLAALENRFRARGFRLLSLNAEPSEWPSAAIWLRQRLPGGHVGLVDGATLRAYGATRLPRLVLVHPDGTVARAFTGLTREPALAAAIERLLPP